MSILDKDPHPFRLPKLAPNEEPELSALNPEVEAEKEFIDLVTLISIGKMVAFSEEKKPEISYVSLQESLKILQTEIANREKYKETDSLKDRNMILIYYRDLYASEIAGHYEESESGENILVYDDSIYNPQDENVKKTICRSTSFEYANSPQCAITHIEKERKRRKVSALLSEINIDEINSFGIIPPLPSDYGIIKDEEFEQLINGFAAVSNNNNDRLGK